VYLHPQEQQEQQREVSERSERTISNVHVAAEQRTLGALGVTATEDGR